MVCHDIEEKLRRIEEKGLPRSIRRPRGRARIRWIREVMEEVKRRGKDWIRVQEERRWRREL